MASLVFCQRVHYPLLGLMSISAALKAEGHRVELIMNRRVDPVVEELKRLEPDIVGFSTLIASGDMAWALEVIAGLEKSPDYSPLVVIGGLYPTVFPEEVITSELVDIACLGEGELPMRELCRCIDQGKDFKGIKGLWVRDGNEIVKNPPADLIADLDSLPFVDRDLYQKYFYRNHHGSIDILAGRGCPFRCRFCYNSLVAGMYKGQGKFVRKHSVDYVIDELLRIKERYSPHLFRFMDELFVVNRAWLKEFCAKYRERVGIPFICTARADLIDEENARLLAAAGVIGVCVGLESGNERIRNDLLKKRISDDDLKKTAEILHTHGIKFVTMNMLGIPGESVEDAFATIRLNREIESDYVWHSVFLPYPGLPITEVLEGKGLIPSFDHENFDTTYFKDSPVGTPEINELINLHKLFFLAFKFPRLEFLIRKLIKLPSNIIFELIFMLSYAWLEIRFFKVKLRSIARLGFMNLRDYYR
ncbi:MAG: B12-binding domain-containing radical SAM protein [Candidatus Thiosymbion ectosymbiont of Robbea hypermnestra]|nr:B12-binding domain-containing radical SAM protein [Candidatus Thiosymbion ectosymbiont of Robbea hypermnestra]